MLIKGKGLFPAKGHEWEFVTHVDHNESSLRGHNVEPRVLSPFFSLSLSSYLPSRIRGVHEQRNEISSLASIVVETDPLRSRNGSCYPLWGDSVHLSRSELIIRKYYFCIIDAAGQMSISGREKKRRVEKKLFSGRKSWKGKSVELPLLDSSRENEIRIDRNRGLIFLRRSHNRTRFNR